MGESSKPNINDANKYIRDRWAEIKALFTSATGNSLLLTCVYRSPQEQAKLYEIGRSKPGKIVTNCDGVIKKSNHNYFPSRAIDVAVISNGKVIWDNDYYDPLGIVCKKLNLVWGGSWTGFKDRPHIECPK